MKKYISVILAVSTLLSVLVLFSACGSDASKETAENFEEILESTPFSADIDKKDLNAFTPESGMGNGENEVYNYENSGMGFVLNKVHNASNYTRFIIDDAVYADIIGDKEEEVLVLGKEEDKERTTVALFGYGDHPFTEERKMQKMAYAYYDYAKDYGFVKNADGSVNLVEKDKNGKAAKDLGKIIVNGCWVETESDSVIKSGSKGHEAEFVDPEKLTLKFNGKQTELPADFALKPFDDALDIYYSCEFFEKLTGEKMKSCGEDYDQIGITVVNGKKYIHFISIPKYFDFEFTFDTPLYGLVINTK